MCRLANPYSDKDWDAWEKYVRFAYAFEDDAGDYHEVSLLLRSVCVLYDTRCFKIVTPTMEAFCLVVAYYYAKGLNIGEVRSG